MANAGPFCSRAAVRNSFLGSWNRTELYILVLPEPLLDVDPALVVIMERLLKMKSAN
jgi:hypothetical protein